MTLDANVAAGLKIINWNNSLNKCGFYYLVKIITNDNVDIKA